MPPRNTGSGAVLEAMVLPAHQRGGYTWQTQINIGVRFGGGRHFVDVVATAANGEQILVSLKWQQVSGTAEQKVPFEAMCLAEAVRISAGGYVSAYLVLGGPGWKLREFFTRGPRSTPGLLRAREHRHLRKLHCDRQSQSFMSLRDAVATG